MSTQGSSRGTWSGSLAFILAASGSAIGLGNIWKFPFITGMNGGGAFVLVYIVCIALVGLPLLTAEILVGRMTGQEAVGSYTTLSPPGAARKFWSIFGWLAVLTGFVLLSYYSVVGGWTIAYAIKAMSGTFIHTPTEKIPDLFGAFVGNNVQQVGYHLVFMCITVGIVMGGVSGGIERAAKFLMPALGVLMLILLVNSLMMDGSGKAIEFMFSPDTSKLTPSGVLEALGHAFFTLSLGMGAMIVYGSYLGKEQKLFPAALSIALLDTLIALVAGVMIFGIVFSHDLEPNAGPSLIFKTMPLLFAQMPYGMFFATLFFLLLAFAAITSAISLLEVVVAYFVDKRGMARKKATIVFGAAIYVFGLLSALSSGALSDIKLLGERNFFDTFDYLVSNWSLPIGGMAIGIFAGWVVKKSDLRAQVENDPMGKALYVFWLFCTRLLAPVAVFVVILHALKVF